MTSHRLRAFGDLALSLVVVLLAALLFVGARSLPPPRFEPLGSAAAPRILGVVLIVLAAVIALRAVIALVRGGGEDDAPAVAEGAHPWWSALLFAALILYVAALDFGRVPFWAATAVFLGVAGFILTGWRWRAALIYMIFGGVLGLALSWVFTNFLYISIG